MNLFNKLYTGTSTWFIKNLLLILLLLTFLVSSVIVLFPYVVIKIPAGFLGVLYRPFSNGVVEDKVLDEGYKLISPWNSVAQYSSRIQLKKLELDVLTSDQLRSKVAVTFQFEVNPYTLPLLHKYVGPQYIDTLVVPEVTSITREMFGRLSSSQAFTSGINQVVKDIAINADRVIIDKLSPPGLTAVRLVRISAVQLDSIAYPPEIQAAIQNKLVESQNAEAYVYKIQAAKQEVDRKVIEADGVKKYQDIVNAGLTENYLKLKGIEATSKLSESNNSKIVIFGNSPGGLPVILGGDFNQEPKQDSQSKFQAKSDVQAKAEVKPDSQAKVEKKPEKSTDK